jgi:signal transduction histidine kinase
MSMAGLIAIWAIKYYAQQQEKNYLVSYAETIADQAHPFLRPFLQRNNLSQLVQSASFFGNVQVQILDEDNRILVDSGNPDNGDGIAWMFLHDQEFGLFPEDFPADWIFGILPHQGGYLFGNQLDIPSDFQPDISYSIVRRSSGPWGNRFSFEIVPYREAQEILIPVQDSSPDIPRSNRVISVPIGEPGDIVGYVELSSSTDFSAEALSFTRHALILAASGAVFAAVILGLIMGNRFTNPITNLSNTTQEMSAGNLSVRASISGKDEISDLAVQFNTMADSLENSFGLLQDEKDALRRFISDASHELRTPITAIKNYNDLLQNSALDDPTFQIEFLKESEKQIERLTWITHNLLDLSRLEGGVASLDIRIWDVEEMLVSAVSPFKPIAEKNGIELQVTSPTSPVEIECDRTRFEIVIANLLENGIKFTQEGGSIEIGAEQQGNLVAVWVKDNGIGIPLEEQMLIFDRFYKGQIADDNSSGLGLSIVKSILHAHGGEVKVESSPSIETNFTTLWPMKIKQDASLQHPV